MISKLETKAMMGECDVFKVNCSHTLASMIQDYGNNMEDCIFLAYQHKHELDSDVEISVKVDSSAGSSSELLLLETTDTIYTDLFSLSESVERLCEEYENTQSYEGIPCEPEFRPTFDENFSLG